MSVWASSTAKAPSPEVADLLTLVLLGGLGSCFNRLFSIAHILLLLARVPIVHSYAMDVGVFREDKGSAFTENVLDAMHKQRCAH